MAMTLQMFCVRISMQSTAAESTKQCYRLHYYSTKHTTTFSPNHKPLYAIVEDSNRQSASHGKRWTPSKVNWKIENKNLKFEWIVSGSALGLCVSVWCWVCRLAVYVSVCVWLVTGGSVRVGKYITTKPKMDFVQMQLASVDGWTIQSLIAVRTICTFRFSFLSHSHACSFDVNNARSNRCKYFYCKRENILQRRHSHRQRQRRRQQ